MSEFEAEVLRRLGGLEGSIGSVAGRLGTLEGSIGTLEGRLGTLEGSIGTLEGRLGTLEGRLGSVEGRLGTLEGSIGSVEGRLGTLETGQKALTAKVDALADLPEKVDRVLAVAQGQAAARVTTDERLTVLERRVADLERRDRGLGPPAEEAS